MEKPSSYAKKHYKTARIKTSPLAWVAIIAYNEATDEYVIRLIGGQVRTIEADKLTDFCF